MRQSEGSKSKNLPKFKTKGSNESGVKNSKGLKGSKLLKRPLFSFGNKSDLQQNSETQRGEIQAENGGVIERADTMVTNRLGHLVQGQSSEDSRRGNSPNSSDTDRNSGMFRGRAGTSMEASLSHNSSKHQNRRSSFGSQRVESHAEPVVEIPHGHSGDFLGGSGGVEQATTAISCAPLGRFRVVNSRRETGGFSGDGYGSHGEPPNFETDPTHGPSVEVRRTTLLQEGDRGYSEVHDNMEARVDSFQKPFEEDEMEYGGVSDNEC